MKKDSLHNHYEKLYLSYPRRGYLPILRGRAFFFQSLYPTLVQIVPLIWEDYEASGEVIQAI